MLRLSTMSLIFSQSVAQRTRWHSQPGQSLIEFAVLLPAVLVLILLIVRVMMILNVWYSVTNAADIAVRAVALTGNTNVARQLVIDNLPGIDTTRLVIKFVPDQPVFKRYVTPTPNPTPTGRAPKPTETPDVLAMLNPDNIPDNPVRIEVSYDMQIAGPLVPAWTIRLGANATARMEPRVTAAPTREFF